MTIREIIMSYRKEHGLSQREFSRMCEVSNSYISMIENEKNPKTGEPITPSIQMLKALAHGMGMSLHQLLSAADDAPVTIPSNDGFFSPFDAPNIIPIPTMKQVPLLGTIACGEPILAAENLDGYVKMPEQVHADFALRCKGDSMTGARINDGDIVFIAQCPDVDNGTIAAVLIDEEATLKRVYKSAGKLILQPENPQYEPLMLVGEELDAVRIIGRAVAFLSAVN